MSKKAKLVFSGGHHNSAIATIDYLVDPKNLEQIEGTQFDFVWVGQKFTGQKEITPEYKEVTDRNIKFYNLKAGKLFRYFSIRNLPLILKGFALIPIGFVQSFFILLMERPNLIVSFGGYIGLPLVLAGRLLGIKSVLHEQTTILGLANAISARFVSRIMVSWPEEFYNIPASLRPKLVQTGLPVRKSLLMSDQKISFSNDKPTVYITGGKRGSLFINGLVLDSLGMLLEEYNLIWSCGIYKGDADYNHIKRLIDEKFPSAKKNILLQKYFYGNEVDAALKGADVVVTRGGAHTVYELAVLGKKAVILPISWSINNEQYKNARVLEKIGLGVILSEDDANKDSFVKSLKNAEGLVDIKEKSLVLTDAAGRVSHEIINIIN